MAIDIKEARELFLWLALYNAKEPETRSVHDQRIAHGNLFDTYTVTQKQQIDLEIEQCKHHLKACQSARQRLLDQLQQLEHFRQKGYPGGEKRKLAELKAMANCHDLFERTVDPLKKSLEKVRGLQRTLPGESFIIKSIGKIRDWMEEQLSNFRGYQEPLKEEIASMEDAQPVKIDPHAEREANKKRLRSEVGDGPLDEEPPLLSFGKNWVFTGDIGGGMGVASLWITLNDHGVVSDRIVRKDTPMRREQWTDSRYWARDPTDSTSWIPLEYYCHKLVQDRQFGYKIVRARKCELVKERMIFRLFTEYCPYGDLDQLIQNNNMHLKKIPEAWVWVIFGHLVYGGIAMEYDSSGTEPPRSSTQIVHRDLKPSNIFIDLAHPRSCPKYPTAKVGDFGLAILTSREDDENPLRWKGLAGTHGYLGAPEQRKLGMEPLKAPLAKLLSHTNVWGVGRIMLDIVNQTPSHSKKGPDYTPTGTFRDSIFKDEATMRFSHTLLTTIIDCLKFEPASRPTFEDLNKRIMAVTTLPETGPHNAFERCQVYLHNAARGVQPDDAAHDLHGLPDEQYKMGMAFQSPSPGKRTKHKAVASAEGGASVRRR